MRVVGAGVGAVDVAQVVVEREVKFDGHAAELTNWHKFTKVEIILSKTKTKARLAHRHVHAVDDIVFPSPHGMSTETQPPVVLIRLTGADDGQLGAHHQAQAPPLAPGDVFSVTGEQGKPGAFPKKAQAFFEEAAIAK